LLLLRELQREFGMAVIFVTHDIGVAVEICDRVSVMYAGRIVETGTMRDVVQKPAHPYTQGLLASTIGGKRCSRLEAIPGAPIGLDHLGGGCAFAPRCRANIPECLNEDPLMVTLSTGHAARCIRLEETASN
jgi:peptide/nickel transport system ATP-binding protein